MKICSDCLAEGILKVLKEGPLPAVHALCAKHEMKHLAKLIREEKK